MRRRYMIMREMKMWTKIKDTWNDLSKKAKIFLSVVAAIILYVLINNWIS